MALLIASIMNGVPAAFFVLFATAILICWPLAFFKRSRSASGVLCRIISCCAGIMLWISSAISAYIYFGLFGLISGVVMLGVGIIPVGIFGVIIHGSQNEIIGLVLMLSFVIATWTASGRLLHVPVSHKELSGSSKPIKAQTLFKQTLKKSNENPQQDKMSFARDEYNRKNISFLEEKDRNVLFRLIQVLRQLLPYSRCGQDLIALGEAWEAIEQMMEGEPVEANVQISLGFRRGDKDFQEGIFVGLEISVHGIVLDELCSEYSSEAGSDHQTHLYARLQYGMPFDRFAVERWIGQLEQVRSSSDDVQLSTERNHV